MCSAVVHVDDYGRTKAVCVVCMMANNKKNITNSIDVNATRPFVERNIGDTESESEKE